MTNEIESKLQILGIDLPTPAAPIANYVGANITGNLLIISGQLCFGTDGSLRHTGRLGAEVTLEAAQEAAKFCAINLLAQARLALGDLDRIKKCVRLGGFINAIPEAYQDLPKAMNGASDFIVQVLGDKGRHARTTIGVAVLPMNAVIEVEGMFEIA